MGENRYMVQYYECLDLWIKSLEARLQVEALLGRLGRWLDRNTPEISSEAHEQPHRRSFEMELETDWRMVAQGLQKTSIDLLREATAYGAQAFGFAKYHKCAEALDLLSEELLHDNRRMQHFAHEIRGGLGKARTGSGRALSIVEIEKRYRCGRWKKRQNYTQKQLDEMSRTGTTMHDLFEQEWTGEDYAIIPGIRETIPWLNEWMRYQKEHQ